MAASEEWTQGEVVRAINRLSSALDRFETSVAEAMAGLDAKYVSREVYDRDLRAMQERNRATSSWLRELVAPTVTGIVVALVVLVLTRSLR